MSEDFEKEEINRIIGNNVKFIRTQNNLSQEQFAEKVDLSTQFVSDLERGVYGISLSTAIKICNIMKCSPSILFSKLVNFEGYTNTFIDDFIALNDKNKGIVSEIVSALLKNQ